MPDNIVVEVPGFVNKEGVCGLKLENYPSDFPSLLMYHASVMRLTTEAILKKSKDKAQKSILVDPVVDNTVKTEKPLDKMIEIQEQHLDI